MVAEVTRPRASKRRDRERRPDQPDRAQLAAFFGHVSVDRETGCWLWTGTKGPKGDGMFPDCPFGPARPTQARPMASRTAWQWFGDKRLQASGYCKLIPTCGNPSCVLHRKQVKCEPPQPRPVEIPAQTSE